MAAQIEDFVRNCPVCAQTKLNSQNGKALLQPIEMNEPFDFWAMDYMGPHFLSPLVATSIYLLSWITSMSGVKFFPHRTRGQAQ